MVWERAGRPHDGAIMRPHPSVRMQPILQHACTSFIKAEATCSCGGHTCMVVNCLVEVGCGMREEEARAGERVVCMQVSWHRHRCAQSCMRDWGRGLQARGVGEQRAAWKGLRSAFANTSRVRCLEGPLVDLEACKALSQGALGAEAERAHCAGPKTFEARARENPPAAFTCGGLPTFVV